MRTKSWVESRIGSDGTMNAYVNAMRNANSVKSSTNSWEYTGPYEIPGGTQARYQSSKGWIWSCQVNPVNHNEIYIGAHHGGVWKTTDGGVNWYPLCDEYPLIGGIISLAIDWDAGLNGEDIIYAASTASDDTYWGYSTGVFKSVDGGSSWSDINNGDLADLYPRFCFKYTARKIIIHPNNSDIIYYLTYDNIYKSTNAGTTWSNIKNDTFSWSGSGGGSTTLASLSYSNYTVNEGFNITSGGLSSEEVVGFFPHEVGHELYHCPHLMGANSTRGNQFYFPSSGWGMMSNVSHSMICANAWEAWILNWIDLTTGASNVNSNLESSDDLNTNGNYEIRDLVTTGDAIRVKLPNVDNTYLWIENHQKLAVSEHKPWKDANPSWQVSNELIPDSENGIYMFIESVADDRENFSTGIVYDLDAINCIKPINAQGNYDYIRSEYPKLDPLNTNLTDDRYFWNNITYTFTRTNENPSS